MIKTKPKLEDFIPFLGLKHYTDKCGRDEGKCYDLDGRLVDEHIDFTIEMTLYHTVIGSALIGGTISTLACLLEYMMK